MTGECPREIQGQELLNQKGFFRKDFPMKDYLDEANDIMTVSNQIKHFIEIHISRQQTQIEYLSIFS